MDFAKIFPPINLKKVKPQIDSKKNIYSWKTYATKPSSMPIIADYVIRGGSKNFTLTFGDWGWRGGPISSLTSGRSNQGGTDLVVFNKKVAPNNIHFLEYKTEGAGRTVEIDFWDFTTPTGIKIKHITVNPDNSISIEWRQNEALRFSAKSIYDNQGNLTYMIKKFSSGDIYELELLSPGTYRVRLYSYKGTVRWASHMKKPIIIHI